MIDVVVFSRLTITFLLAASFLGKIRDFDGFRRTVSNFRIVPESLSLPSSILVLAAELAVAVLLGMGGRFLGAGFVLASVLLLAFIAVLVSAIARGIDTPCNCFGSGDRPVSGRDVRRNAGYLLCALSGLLLLPRGGEIESPGIAGWLLTSFVSVAFLLLWTHVEEVVGIFRPPRRLAS